MDYMVSSHKPKDVDCQKEKESFDIHMYLSKYIADNELNSVTLCLKSGA